MTALLEFLQETMEDTKHPLPKQLTNQLERLRRERINAYAEQPLRNGSQVLRTNLEANVDELLDLLYTAHRLNSLAWQAAQGEPITTQEDQILIADHSETFMEFYRQFDKETYQDGAIVASILPGIPVPIDGTSSQ